MILINYSTCRRRAFTSHGITADTTKGSTMSSTTRTDCDCRYSASHADVSRSFAHYSGYVAQWEDAAKVSGTRREKVQAADEIGLNLQNLQNFDRATAIGLAEVLLRHLANTTGLVDFYGLEDDTDTFDNWVNAAGTTETALEVALVGSPLTPADYFTPELRPAHAARYVPYLQKWEGYCDHDKCETLHANSRRYRWETASAGNRYHVVTRSEWIVIDTTTGERADNDPTVFGSDLSDAYETKREAVAAIARATH
jgi:hypothetical protein